MGHHGPAKLHRALDVTENGPLAELIPGKGCALDPAFSSLLQPPFLSAWWKASASHPGRSRGPMEKMPRAGCCHLGQHAACTLSTHKRTDSQCTGLQWHRAGTEQRRSRTAAPRVPVPCPISSLRHAEPSGPATREPMVTVTTPLPGTQTQG